jgi:ATP-dependent Lhr-like helicase
MELSGEVFSGYFFQNVPGPQFVTPGGFRRLQKLKGDKSNEVYWLSAQDPASLCGIGLDELKGQLPKRVVSNHMVYRGSELILTSQRNGKEIEISVSSDDEILSQVFGLFEHLLTRKFHPLNKLKIEKINGEKASNSEYLSALKQMFDVIPDYKEVTLYRKYS